jgi:hypothetical protein
MKLATEQSVRSMAAAALLAASISPGCSGSTTTEPDAVPNTQGRLTIAVKPLVLGIGESGQATASVTSGKVTTNVTADSTWQSSDSAIAAIRSDGFVSAVAKGNATITGRYQDLSGSVNIRVLAGDEVRLVYACGAGCGVRLDGSEVWRLNVGQTQRLVPRAIFDRTTISSTVYDVQPGTRSIWVSSNIDIASVTPDGLVTAVDKGEAEVMATWAGATATITITVF